MIETELQHKEIMPFFCKPEESGGLGYRETEPNIVSDDLFIPSQLAEFVKTARLVARGIEPCRKFKRSLISEVVTGKREVA